MSDDFDPVRQLRPDRIEPDDPADPAVFSRAKEHFMSTIDHDHAPVEVITTPDIYPRLESLSARLVDGVLEAAAEADVAMVANRVGSMFTWFFTNQPVTHWTSAARADTQRFGRWHNAMLHAGIYLPPSQFEAAFLSAAHTQQDVEETIAAAREALRA